eukprot:GHRR01028919.1.p2 GENE.GHRR01028919.1~~GHRR01028919.1.p2  ORF type:complete len:163 (+),score=42.85 GHRR01028919.1:171-659(+)
MRALLPASPKLQAAQGCQAKPQCCPGAAQRCRQQTAVWHRFRPFQVMSNQLFSLAASMVLCSSAYAATADANFTSKCVGCHINGGNIIQAGAALSTSDLQKNNVVGADSLYKLIYEGKNRMPGFGLECAPKGKCTFGPRLTDEEIHDLSQYVLKRAADDWKQ